MAGAAVTAPATADTLEDGEPSPWKAEAASLCYNS